jgi:hypothetical protein
MLHKKVTIWTKGEEGDNFKSKSPKIYAITALFAWTTALQMQSRRCKGGEEKL